MTHPTNHLYAKLPNGQPAFVYTKSCGTDIRETFARFRQAGQFDETKKPRRAK